MSLISCTTIEATQLTIPSQVIQLVTVLSVSVISILGVGYPSTTRLVL